MTEINITIILIQLFFSIPLFIMIKNWKKTKIFLKVMIIVTFLFTIYVFHSYYSFNPINHKISSSDIEAGETFEFEFYPRGKRYQVGFEAYPPFSLENEDLDIIFNDSDIEFPSGDYGRLRGRGSKYCERQCFRYVDFLNPNKKTKVIYKFNKELSEGNSIILYVRKLSDIGISLELMLLSFICFILVYGSIGLYFGVQKIKKYFFKT